MLVAGLIAGNDSFLIGTLVVCLLAAACLYAASRNRGGASSTGRRTPTRFLDEEEDDTDVRLRGRRRPAESAGAGIPVDRKQANRRSERQDYLDIDVEVDAVPADEPDEMPMSSVEAAALMRMDAEVMVVDGRPRFHLGGCVHLAGRDSEPLPAYEAVELGFSACALCRPAQSLLREPTSH